MKQAHPTGGQIVQTPEAYPGTGEDPRRDTCEYREKRLIELSREELEEEQHNDESLAAMDRSQGGKRWFPS